MHLPSVRFSDDSAGALECVAWASKSILNGRLRDDALNDVPCAVMVVSRVIHAAAEAAFAHDHPMVSRSIGDPEIQYTHWAALSDACGVPPLPVMSASGPSVEEEVDGTRAIAAPVSKRINWQALLPVLLNLLPLIFQKT